MELSRLTYHSEAFFIFFSPFLFMLVGSFISFVVTIRSYDDGINNKYSDKRETSVALSRIFLSLGIFGCFTVLSIFEFVPWYVGTILSLLGIFIVVMLTQKALGRDLYPKRKKHRKEKIVLITIITIVVVIFAFLVNFLVGGLCFALHPLEVSTRGTRFFSTDTCAKSTKPCHVYLTFGKNISSQVIVHYHMGVRDESTFVYYDIVPHANYTDYKNRAIPEINYMDVLQPYTDRYIYLGFLNNLAPSTKYYFTIVSKNVIIDKQDYRTFITGPADDTPFNFAVGGDLGMDPGSGIVLQQSSFTSPLFLLLGGDITYENGIPACYGRWDKWLNIWEKIMVTPSGSTIPIIAAIGNHEAGGVNKKVSQTPFFRSYLVHEPYPKGMSPDDLNSYRDHVLGSNAAILCLDSYINVKPEEQKTWMIEKFEQYKNRSNVFAIYHVGLYPSKRSPTTEPHSTLRKEWGPIFDKYLKIGFENHDHLYKRTFLMKDGEKSKDGKGVLYIGDGAFGVKDAMIATKYDYLSKLESKLFFFNIFLNGTNVNIQATDDYVLFLTNFKHNVK
jgi:hypothetical protein